MSFQVGDRVKVYGQVMDIDRKLIRNLGGGYLYGAKATITGVCNEDTELLVEFDAGGEAPVHPKQCRKLKAKPSKPGKRSKHLVYDYKDTEKDTGYKVEQVQYGQTQMGTPLYKYRIRPSKYDKTWVDSIRGKILASVTCDDNGYDVAFDEGLKFRLDYAQAQELRLLLQEAETEFGDRAKDYVWKTYEK